MKAEIWSRRNKVLIETMHFSIGCMIMYGFVYFCLCLLFICFKEVVWLGLFLMALLLYLHRRPAELPLPAAHRVMDEQRFAVAEAAAPGVHSAAQRRDGRLRNRHVVLLRILGASAVVVVVMRDLVRAVAAALAGADACDGAQRAGQLPPCPAAGGLAAEAQSCGAPWRHIPVTW